MRISTKAGARGQVDRHGSSGQSVGQSIIADTAAEDVCARPTGDDIIATRPDQLVICCSAGKNIGEAGADNPFDTKQGVTQCITTGARRTIQCDFDAAQGGGIISRIAARTSGQSVRPGPTDQLVIASATDQLVSPGTAGKPVSTVSTFEPVGRRRTGQVIGKSAASDVFDAAQHIALRIAADARGAIQRQCYARS